MTPTPESRQQELLPQDDDELPHEDELPHDDELPQEEELPPQEEELLPQDDEPPPQEEPFDESPQDAEAAYQDDMSSVPASGAALPEPAVDRRRWAW
ncbi:hypothetical protein [Streptomyces sp. NPDC002132]|uniref:hypothetical protein n=1 Tax=unclassified Streptomyces TaxID=2593676 RepID=UPI00331663F1